MNMLEALIDKIHPVVRAIEPAVIARLDSLTKPPGSLGKLEKTEKILKQKAARIREGDNEAEREAILKNRAACAH